MKSKMLEYNLQLFAEDDKKEESQTDDTNVNNDSDDFDGSKQEQEKERIFTQTQVSKMMTREKNQGRNQILRELGLDPRNEKDFENAKALIASQKSEEQLNLEKEKAVNLALEQAEQRAILAETKAEAMMAGIKPQYVEDVVILAMAKIGEDGDLKNVLAEFKTKYPVWFENPSDDKDVTKVGQKGTGSSIKAGTNAAEEKGIGSRLAAQKKPTNNNNNKSFWSM